jgi:hypothetical protein
MLKENIMNFIRKIKETIDDNCETFKVAFFPDEMAVYLWEKEVPISVFVNQTGDQDSVVLDIEGYDWKLTTYQVKKIGEVMQILLDSMEEIREITGNV